MKKLISILLILILSTKLSYNQQKSIIIDASDISKRIDLLIGTNAGPEGSGNIKQDFTNFFKDICIQAIRTHDYYGPCDWWTIFPKWNADVNNPESYNFMDSDQKVMKIVNNGFDVLFRLGISWKGNNQLPINDPPGTIRDANNQVIHIADTNDFKKFAEICRHIIMHYNDGWANGYRLNIKKWEIWNEPTLKEQFWNGTTVQFFQMFSIVAKKLKGYFPNIQIGGPAQEGQININYEKDFIAYCKDNNCPLDFYSYHSYGGERFAPSPWHIAQRAIQVKEALNNNNYTKTKIICDEWNALPNQYNFSTSGKGAAFYASTLIYFVHYGVCESYQYRADNHPLGLINENGTDTKRAAESMKAWKYLTQNPILMNSQETLDTSGFASIATMDEKKENIRILVSNYEYIKQNIQLSIQNLTSADRSKWILIRKLIDNSNRLTSIDSSVLYQKKDSLNFNFPMNEESVQLIELTKLPLELPFKVILLEPKNDSILKNDTINLVWNQSIPDIIKYHIEIYLGKTVVVTDSTLTDTSYQYFSMQSDTHYSWKVRAKNLSGWGEWSEQWGFKSKANVGINYEVYVNNEIQIVPNPASEHIQIIISNNKSLDREERINIFNYLGQRVFSDIIIASSNSNYNIDISDFPKGIYYIKINNVVRQFSKI